MATIKPDGECWQPEIEKMPREQLQQLQVKKLKDTINVRMSEVAFLQETIRRCWYHGRLNQQSGRFA